MKKRKNTFLDAAERLEIEKKIRAVEAETTGEIVVMAVPASSLYPAAGLAGSMLYSLLAAVTGTLMYGSESMWLMLFLFGICFILFSELLRRIPLFRRPFISRKEMDEEVAEAAIGAFYDRKINETRDRTGILIYISAFEHSIRVLADRGINAKVGQHEWQVVADTIIRGIRDKRQGEAVASAVDHCSILLRTHFPGKHDDHNELSDAVIVGF